MKTWQTNGGYMIKQLLSGRSNVFLIMKGDKKILIDTSPEYMWGLLDRRLTKLGIEHIDYLILTHAHFDHSGNSSRIKEKYRARVMVHRKEATYLLSGENIIPVGTNFFSRTITNLMGKYVSPFIRYRPCQSDLLVDTMFDLSDFGFNAYIMHTPGHTEGSMSVIVDNEIALVGDCMFGVFKWSVFPPFANDVKHMIESWGKLLGTNCSLFLPAHGTANSRSLVQKEYNRWRMKISGSRYPC